MARLACSTPSLATNLYRLGVPEKTIQAILRHANVSTTNTYYIKSASDDTRVAMAKLEKLVRDRIAEKIAAAEEDVREYVEQR